MFKHFIVESFLILAILSVWVNLLLLLFTHMTQMQWRQMSQIMFMKLATMHYFTTSSVILSSIQFYLYTLIHAWLCHGISVSIRGLGVGCRVLYWTTDHGNVAKLGLAKLWNVLINPFLKIICTNYFGTKRRRGGGCFFVFVLFFYRSHILFFIAMWDFTVLPLFFVVFCISNRPC